jgi:hypothetical protein
MKWLFRVVLGLVVTAAIYMAVSHRTNPHEPLPSIDVDLSARAREMRSGEVLLLTVSTSRDVDLVQGGAFGSDIPFWSTTGLRRWQGLVAIPRGTPAGARTLPVQVTTKDGTIATATLTLEIELDRQRPVAGSIIATGAMTGDTAGVPEELSAEAQALDDVLMTTRPGRLWTGRWADPLSSTAGGVTTVKAPNAGEIVLVARRRSTGLTVVIEHGEGLYSIFDHLTRARVAVGDHVAAADVIGELASTSAGGWATRLHNEDVAPESLVYAAQGADDVAASSH